jgi:hypothetical protein
VAKLAELDQSPTAARGLVIPNEGSTLAGMLYWARYKSFWFGAISRIATFNGVIGLLLWAIDEGTGRHSDTLLLIRSNLFLTAFVAALIALAYSVGRLGVLLDPEEPFTNPAVPVFVAVGEAGMLVLLLLVLRLRNWQDDAYLVIKGVLIGCAAILLGGVGAGIATGQLLETRFSAERVDELMRLFVFLFGMSLYFIEERRYWRSRPPTPVAVQRLQRACKQNDFTEISRWLGEGLVFTHEDQRRMADLILPRRLIVDGDLAGLATPGGDFLLFRVHRGQVVEMRRYEGAGSLKSALAG